MFRGEKVLVTGATGSIGGHLVDRLLQEGAEVHALVRSPGKAEQLQRYGIQPHVGDITNVDVLRAAAEGCGTIFHLAAWLGIALHSREAEEVNVGGTQNVATAAGESGAKVVHLSSIAVYGNQDGIINERASLEAKDAYGRTKIAAERVLRDSGVNHVNLRPGPVYGPNVEMWTLFAHESLKKRWVGKVAGKPPLLIGDGSGSFNACYVDDLVETMVRAATNPAANGREYNVVGNDHPTWRDFVEYHAKLLNVTAAWVPAFLAIAAGAVGDIIPAMPINSDTVQRAMNNSRIDNSRVKKELGVQFTSFDVAMSRTMRWLQQQERQKQEALT